MQTQNIVKIGPCSDINLQNLLADYSLIYIDLTKRPMDNWCKIRKPSFNRKEHIAKRPQNKLRLRGMNTIPHSSISGTPTKKELGSLDPRSGIYSDPLT